MTLQKLSIAAKLYMTLAVMAVSAGALEAASESDAPAWLSMALGVALVAAIAGAIMVVRRIAVPLGELAYATEQVAAGDAAVSIPFSERGD